MYIFSLKQMPVRWLMIAVLCVAALIPMSAHAAALDIVFEQEPLFSDMNFVPGHTVTRSVHVTNTVDVPIEIGVRVTVFNDPDGLGEVIEVVITDNGSTFFQGALKEFYDAGVVPLSSLSSGQSVSYDVSLTLQNDAQESYQGKELGFDLLFGNRSPIPSTSPTNPPNPSPNGGGGISSSFAYGVGGFFSPSPIPSPTPTPSGTPESTVSPTPVVEDTTTDAEVAVNDPELETEEGTASDSQEGGEVLGLATIGTLFDFACFDTPVWWWVVNLLALGTACVVAVRYRGRLSRPVILGTIVVLMVALLLLRQSCGYEPSWLPVLMAVLAVCVHAGYRIANAGRRDA